MSQHGGQKTAVPVRRAHACRCSVQQGFTLLEILVAFAIMAISMAMIYRSMGASARTTADISIRQEAVLLAESLLQTQDSVLETGWNETGVLGQLSWQVVSEPYDVIPNAPLRLHKVRVGVTWKDGPVERKIQVSTLLPQRKSFAGEAAR